ncbi:MAG: adenosylcobinamide-GDP ribazoletransferase [Albidovulum sp.]|uniref:adenosylcobinamide-GDP ribazoletransferase n=1 Tax=Albidovulum sp. TaxID=1872424 RepID=UPI003C8EE525
MSPARSDEVRLAFMLLSRLPAGRIDGEPPSMAASSWAWPLVGLAIGLIAALACGLGLWIGLPPLMAALLALAAGVLATGAMHEDGLADLADGFGGGGDRDRKLEIMRDSRIGSYGVVALILALAFRVTGIATLAEAGSAMAALIGIAAASRAMLPAALLLMPAARSDGLGKSAAGDDPTPAMIAGGIGFLCLLPLGPGTAILTGFAMVLTALILAGIAMRQIGGQTGDVMGAMQQMAEIAGWAVLAAMV